MDRFALGPSFIVGGGAVVELAGPFLAAGLGGVQALATATWNGVANVTAAIQLNSAKILVGDTSNDNGDHLS